MNTYRGTFWRSNPQLKNGGYETTREVEAKTIASAKKKLNQIANNCRYSGMDLLDVVKVEA